MATKNTSDETQRSSKITNNVIKSKRRRFQEDEEDSVFSYAHYHLKELLAKELSDYLDRNIEEVHVFEKACNEDERKCNERISKEQSDDFQLFSSSLQNVSASSVQEKQLKCLERNAKDTSQSSSSDDEEDDDTTARLKAAAVSVQDIFGPQFSNGSKTALL